MENKLERTGSYRGWDIRIFQRADGTFTAEYENEFTVSALPDESQPTDSDSCFRKAMRAIDLNDSFDPQFRSAAFKDIEPRPYDKWLIGEEAD